MLAMFLPRNLRLYLVILPPSGVCMATRKPKPVNPPQRPAPRAEAAPDDSGLAAAAAAAVAKVGEQLSEGDSTRLARNLARTGVEQTRQRRGGHKAAVAKTAARHS